jgi:thioredoxin 1
MSSFFPLNSTLIAVAIVVAAAALLWWCPSSGNCPLTQLFGRGADQDAAPQSGEAQEAPAAAPSEPSQADTPVADPEGETMNTAETQPRYGKVIHANVRDFEQVVLRSKVPVLVDFYADWCRPCRMLAPTLEQLAREMPHVKIVKIDVEANPELAGYFGVSSIPALMVFKEGNVVASQLGLADKASVKRMIQG